MPDGSWGPWVPCDGKGCPVALADRERFEVRFRPYGIRPPQQIVSASWPGFFWRWTRVRTGFLRWERVRVCRDPAYAPILAPRRWTPPAREVTTHTDVGTDAGLALLRRIAGFQVTPAREDA